MKSTAQSISAKTLYNLYCTWHICLQAVLNNLIFFSNSNPHIKLLYQDRSLSIYHLSWTAGSLRSRHLCNLWWRVSPKRHCQRNQEKHLIFDNRMNFYTGECSCWLAYLRTLRLHLWTQLRIFLKLIGKFYSMSHLEWHLHFQDKLNC